MITVDSRAEVHPSVELGEGVCVEAGALIEAGCQIGEQTVIGRNTIIWRDTIIGERNRIFPFCSLGGEPQDKKYKGEHAPLIIGHDNTIREYSFINKGTVENEETRIGDRNWIMAYVHIAHDCVIGNDVIMANTCQLAGHVHIDDYAVIGGGALFLQFRRVGRGAIVGGGENIRLDIPPWAFVARGTVHINIEGLRRRGASDDDISQIRHAYRLLYRRHLELNEAIEQMKQLDSTEKSPLLDLIHFLEQPQLHLIRPSEK